MNENSIGLIATTPLAEALALAAVNLPRRTGSLDNISLEVALSAAADMTARNHPENDVLMSVVWLLPKTDAVRLTPDYLLPVLDALPSLWSRILGILAWQPKEESSAEQPDTALNAPQLATTIAAVYLNCLLEMRETDIIFSESRPTPDKFRFYRNLLSLARVLAENAPDLSGERLVATVRSDIAHHNLKPQILPDEVQDRIWQIEVRPEVPDEQKEPVLYALKTFFGNLWLTTGYSQDKAEVDRKRFFLIAEERRAETVPSLERLMTAVSIRFSKLFRVVRMQGCNAQKFNVQWHRHFIDHWHMGLRYEGRHFALLHTQAIDPLSVFVKFETSIDMETQIEQILRMAKSR